MHMVKVFKTLHPDLENNVIVKEAGILHGVDRDTTMAQCYFMLSQAWLRDEHHRQPPSAMNENEEHEVVDLHAKAIGHIGGYNHYIII